MINTIVTTQGNIASRILLLRKTKVMLDVDLAILYQVSTKRLNEQVKRNINRFPSDFMFQISESERAQVVANCDHLSQLKFSHQLPHAFTEQGIAMLSSVLNSERAVQVNIQIIRTFTKIREIMADNSKLAATLEKLENKYDKQITEIFQVLKYLIAEDETPREKIGFRPPTK